MTKFNENEKIQAILRYQNGSESIKTIAKSMGLHYSVLSKWIRQFEYHGEDAFKTDYTSYSAQEKLDVLNHMYEHRTSVRETAAVFNIASHSTILVWQRCVELHGIDALQPKKKGRRSKEQKS